MEEVQVVEEAAKIGDMRDQLAFETLTFVPFDRRLIVVDELSGAERRWLNAYHAAVLDKIGPRVSGEVTDWLAAACAPL